MRAAAPLWMLCMLVSAHVGAVAPLWGGGVARADTPLRVVVRVLDPADDEILRRVGGQTVDLPVALLPTRAPPLEPDLPGQVAAARGLAQAAAARVVVWVAGGQVLYLAEPAAGTLLVRSLAGAGGRTARSAAAETAGLLVRSALRAVLAGDRVGLPAAAIVPRQPPPTPRSAGPPDPPMRGAPPRRRDLGVTAALGWQGVVDGQSPRGLHGVWLRVGLRAGRFSVSATGTAFLPVELSDPDTVVRLSRYEVGLSPGYLLPLGPSWGLGFGVLAGVQLYQRATTALSTLVQPTPDRVVAAGVVGPELRLVFQPRRCRGFGLVAVLGADVPLRAPELGYQSGDSFETRNRFWPVQPRLLLGGTFSH